MTDQYDVLVEELDSAKQALVSILCEKLDNYGIYYRIFSRIKKGESIRHKLKQPRYVQNPDKNIQDLIGVRVVLYFEDDINVCKRIITGMLELYGKQANKQLKPGEDMWEQYQSSEDTFTATKINGVFALPGFVKRIVDPVIENLRVDPTFEIQLRTMFFEGWHEVEHDLRYKNLRMWDNFPKESRKLNSVLASLEMCDQYMVTLFDDMGHDFYKKCNWGEMIRYKYRLKTLNGEIDEQLEDMITVDLAKKIFKWNKEEFIELALERNFNRLNANIIIYLVNEGVKGTDIYKQEIADRFDEIFQTEKQKYTKPSDKEIVKFRTETAFQADVTLNLGDKEPEQLFEFVVRFLYDHWLKKELEEIKPEEFATDVHPIRINEPGIISNLEYDRQSLYLYADLSYVALDESGKIWKAFVEIRKEGDDLLMLCKNMVFKPKRAAKTIRPYARPNVYLELAREIGVKDSRPLRSKIQVVKEEELDALWDLIEDPARVFPVVILTYPDEEQRWQKHSCYGRLVDYASNPKINDQNHLMRKIGYVSHVFCASGDVAAQIAQRLGEDATRYEDGIRFFAKGCLSQEDEGYRSYTQEMINNHPKDIYALHAKEPYCYMSVSGASAMRHDLIQLVYQDILR